MLLSWGANSYGQLGLGYESEQVCSPAAVNLPHLANIKSICGGGGHTLLLFDDGKIYSSGWNNKSQLGLEIGGKCAIFQLVEILNKNPVTAVAAGWDFSAALTLDKDLFVWGSNAFGQLGRSKSSKIIQTPTLTTSDVDKISCGLRHMAFVQSANVFAMGDNSKSQLGTPKDSCTDGIVRVDGITDIISISCGQHHTIALDSKGNVFGWGSNKYGQLALDPEIHPSVGTPMKIFHLPSAVSVHCGWTHSAVLSENGQLYNWGRNSYSQLGCEREHGFEPNKLSVPLLESVSVGSEHCLALTRDKSVLAWGWNEHSSCGDGHTKDVALPKVIMQNAGLRLVTAGSAHSFVVIDNSK